MKKHILLLLLSLSLLVAVSACGDNAVTTDATTPEVTSNTAVTTDTKPQEDSFETTETTAPDSETTVSDSSSIAPDSDSTALDSDSTAPDTNAPTPKENVLSEGTTKGLVYTLSEDGTYYSVTSLGTCTERGVVVASTCNGLPVKKIGEKAFRADEYDDPAALIYEVVLPEGIIEIGDSAFENCYCLVLINIPESVTSLGDYVFYRCRDLKSVSLPDSITSMGEGVFCFCRNLESVKLPTGLTEIPNYTFNECNALAAIDIPVGVARVGDDAFAECALLASLDFAMPLTFVGESAFNGCFDLEIFFSNTGFFSWDANWKVGFYNNTYWQGEWYYDASGKPVLNNEGGNEGGGNQGGDNEGGNQEYRPTEESLGQLQSEAQWVTQHLELAITTRFDSEGTAHKNTFYFTFKTESTTFKNDPVTDTPGFYYAEPSCIYIKDVTDGGAYIKYDISYWEPSLWYIIYARADGFEPELGHSYEVALFFKTDNSYDHSDYPNTEHFIHYGIFGDYWTYTEEEATESYYDNLANFIPDIDERTELISHEPMTITSDGTVRFTFKSDGNPFENELGTPGVHWTYFDKLFINGVEYKITDSYAPESWYIINFTIADFVPIPGEEYEILFTVNSESDVYCTNPVGYYVLYTYEA